MQALLTELSQTFGGEVKMFRQNRDIRFSADKSPYKTNTYGVIYGSGRRRPGPVRLDLRGRSRRWQRLPRDGPRSARALPRARRRQAARHGIDEAGRHGREGRPGAVGAEPRHGSTGLSKGPRADRAAAAQDPHAGRDAEVRTRDQPRRRAPVRHQDVACRGARDWLARRARGRKHAAVDRAPRGR